jgi:hypothetical protein
VGLPCPRQPRLRLSATAASASKGRRLGADRLEGFEIAEKYDNRRMLPLLLLDVDGVLSPTGSGVPPGFERRSTPTYSVVISTDHGAWLQTLSESFELGLGVDVG